MGLVPTYKHKGRQGKKERVEEFYVALVLPPAVPRSTHGLALCTHHVPGQSCGAGIVLQHTLIRERGGRVGYSSTPSHYFLT